MQRYLRHWTSRAFVEQGLASRHGGSLSVEQRRRKARDIAVCVEQGLEYLQAGETGSVLTRPLPLFYASENLAKAICAFLDPSLGADSFKAHGLVRDKAKRRSIKTLSAQVQNPGSDVWSHYLRLGNTERCSLKVNIDGVGRITDVPITFSPIIKKKQVLELGHLLRMLPDLIEDVRNAGWEPSFAVHISNYSIRQQSGPPNRTEAELTLRHGHHKATADLIRSREKTKLAGYERVRDNLDVLRYRRNSEGGIEAALRQNMFGELFFDLNQGHVDLAEPIVLFASLFIMSSATRYDPEQWQRLLERSPAEAILVDRMLRLLVESCQILLLMYLKKK